MHWSRNNIEKGTGVFSTDGRHLSYEKGKERRPPLDDSINRFVSVTVDEQIRFLPHKKCKKSLRCRAISHPLRDEEEEEEASDHSKE